MVFAFSNLSIIALPLSALGIQSIIIICRLDPIYLRYQVVLIAAQGAQAAPFGAAAQNPAAGRGVDARQLPEGGSESGDGGCTHVGEPRYEQ